MTSAADTTPAAPSMRAACLTAYGDADVLQLRRVTRPQAGPRDVLIKLHAAAVNPIDWKIRLGTQRAFIRYRLPHVLGLDGSGEVVAVGRRVTRFKVGDEVYSSPSHRRSGTYAEYAAIAASEVGHKPRNITHQQAAAIPLAGLTAYQCLLAGKLKAGQRVLIQAGSGGVGTFAIQMAKHLGAYVATTCSARNEALVRSLGADEVIDYRNQAFDEVLRDYDMVLDTLGGQQRERAWKVLRRGGRLVTVVSNMPEAVQRWGVNLGAVMASLGMVGFKLAGIRRGKRGYFVLKKCSGLQLDEIAKWVEQGAVKVVIDKVYPLAEIAAAHRHSESKRARGKIVIAVTADSGGEVNAVSGQ